MKKITSIYIASAIAIAALYSIIASYVVEPTKEEFVAPPNTPFTSRPVLPRPDLTPGDVLVTSSEVGTICVAGYSKSVRNVKESVKKKVFELYGIDKDSDSYEIDHLISLELGGSNDIKNLWPQSYTTQPYNAHHKDALENRLHKLVCDGVLSLDEAQKEISQNWIVSYKKRIERQ